MPEFISRTIVNQEVSNPNRYNLKTPGTNTIVMTVDIIPTYVDNPSEIIRLGTEIDKKYLQKIENFLQDVGIEISGLDISIKSIDSNLTNKQSEINTKISNSENNLNSTISAKENLLNGKIISSDNRVTAANATIGTLAPKVNAVLTDPTVTTQPQNNNSTYIANTAWVRTYLTGLMSEYTR